MSCRKMSKKQCHVKNIGSLKKSNHLSKLTSHQGWAKIKSNQIMSNQIKSSRQFFGVKSNQVLKFLESNQIKAGKIWPQIKSIQIKS